MSNKEVRLRKSVAALKGTDERKGYFICLKMLGILPPPPGSGFEQWTFYTPTGTVTTPPTNLYNPKCLHDVLISSHATSCEHRSFYFSFYHRHMMILTEIFLNFAHQILLGGEKRLKEVYTGAKYDFLYNQSNKKIWDAVFTVYQGLKNIPNQISNHYWNPTDFQNPLDLQVPEELANRESSDDPIDALFYNINKAYPWETHVPRRWYQTEDLYKKSDISRFMRSSPVVYTTQQKKFINGELDPRRNPSVYEEMINTSNGPQRKFMYEYTSANTEMIKYRNYLNYDDNKKNMRLNSVTPDESLANYGARSKNLQYITKEEQAQYGLTDDLVKYYNSLLPHYQYAEALFKNSMEEFIGGRTGEISHNYMHNNFKWILSDATFSVTSLVFITYHSWIDAQIEFKLRRGNAPGNESDYYYMRNTLNDQFTAFPESLKNILAPVFDSISEDMLHLANSGLSGDDEIDPDSAGIYPILEWITPTVRQATTLPPTYDSFSPAFCARDLVLTPTNIRDSFHFNEIYQNFYAKNNESRFSFFQGIRTFNYNYNYQIGSDLNNVLDQYATNLPEYLTQMQGIWVTENLPKANALRIVTEQFVKERSFRTEGASLSKEPQQLDEVETTSIRKLFGTGLELFASYPSDAENGPNPVFLKLRNILSNLPKDLTEKEYLDIERYIDYGIDVYDIFIFGKQNFAEACHKCQEKKLSFIDLDDALRVRVPKIWQRLQLYALNKVYFDSREPVSVHSIYDKLTLAPNGKFSYYRLVSGAEEIIVKVETDILTKEAKSIRIDAESYSVAKDSLKNIVTKKFDSLSQNFDFYKIFDVDNKNERIDFDRYVYKRLKGWVLIAGARTKFEFAIPNYQRIIRLTLRVSRDEKGVRVQISDSDFSIKRTYYEKIYQF